MMASSLFCLSILLTTANAQCNFFTCSTGIRTCNNFLFPGAIEYQDDIPTLMKQIQIRALRSNDDQIDTNLAFTIDNPTIKSSISNGMLIMHDVWRNSSIRITVSCTGSRTSCFTAIPPNYYKFRINLICTQYPEAQERESSELSSTTTAGPTPIPTYAGNLGEEDAEKQKTLETVFENILIIIVGTFGCIAVVGYIDAICLRRNDFYEAGAIINAALQILDTISDCFLAIDISVVKDIYPNKPFEIFLYICIICIILPSSLSLFQVYYYSSRVWSSDHNMREWLLNYSKLLYLTSIFTGSSFTAIEIFNSDLFGLKLFEMGLNERQKIMFKTQKMYSVIILENIPQLALQVWYLFLLPSSGSIIAVCSSIFSAISIIVTVLSMAMEKSLIDSQEYTSIKMDVISKNVVSNSKKCRKRVNEIRREISRIVGLNKGLVEMLKPTAVPNGLRVECYLYASNEKSLKHEYGKLIENAKLNGTLAQCMHQSWNLESVPDIINMQVQENKSVKDIKSMRHLKMQKSVENSKVDSNKEPEGHATYSTTNIEVVSNASVPCIVGSDSMIVSELESEDPL